MAKAAKKAGIRMMVGLQGRQSPTAKKIGEMIAAGTIGNVISTSVVASVPNDLSYWGTWVAERNIYTAEQKSGATLARVAMGHFLDPFLQIFGDVETVSATTANQFDKAIVTENMTRRPATNESEQRTVPHNTYNQVACSGRTKKGVFYNFNYRANEEFKEGRVTFSWIIDGDKGTIRMEGTGLSSPFINIEDSPLYLNDKLQEVAAPDDLGNIGRAWFQFAQGKGGNYPTIDDAVRVNRITDAVERSAKDGGKVVKV